VLQNLKGEKLCVVEVIDIAKTVLSLISILSLSLSLSLLLTFLAAYLTFEPKALLGSKVKCAIKKQNGRGRGD